MHIILYLCDKALSYANSTCRVEKPKAYQLLKELEGLQLIHLVKTPVKLSALRQRVKTPPADVEIDEHIAELRNEWERDI